ncbi:hypothetical protein WA026_016327 [Henosepilachna vigintioctopunctata]|uniref:Carboxylic ester hydrolase n=1 Tax=Henosepilachna vigintioctopunctata TaxID=420089 RepID=A0AAW1UFY7_9CUCU
MLITTLIIFTFGSVVADNNPIIHTKYGKVQGEAMETFNKNIFYAFQGIPFAEPPVGELRFKSPQPPRKWKGILGSQNAYKKCVQFDTNIYNPDETEDCLYLNVYTPQIPNGHRNISLPVLVYIHGGAFIMGSGHINEIRPHRIMDDDIIMVSVQYRLGFLGFLSTGDLECPGNYGFKDQQFALRWVQENIRYFGGDPTKVTISGESAGGGSVGLQLLGLNGEGLFRGAIQSSGSSLATWCLQSDPIGHAYQMANHIDKKINKRNTNTSELMRLFKKTDIRELKRVSSDIFGKDPYESFFNTTKGILFTGVIEPDHDGAFLIESAFRKLNSGNFHIVPTLLSINSGEGRGFLSNPLFLSLLPEFDTASEIYVPVDLHVNDRDVVRKIGSEIRKFYIGDEIFQNNLGHSMRLIGDAVFVKPTIKQAQLQAKYTDVYFYEFAYSGRLAHPTPVEYLPGAEAALHADDLKYIFPDAPENVGKFPEIERTTIDRLVSIWTNFVKYLNPSPQSSASLQNITWPKVSPNSVPYLLVNETLEIKHDLKKPMMDEYARIYDLYAIPPLDTY